MGGFCCTVGWRVCRKVLRFINSLLRCFISGVRVWLLRDFVLFLHTKIGDVVALRTFFLLFGGLLNFWRVSFGEGFFWVGLWFLGDIMNLKLLYT